ncbi:uncharacterized protein LOC135806029 [Sycon ciliatum]|uniref:uncharacterized protein LOC135806029 n=1 Tax=Sycon ciliatum TaxID=27933 RepID=UPI0031F706D0
MALIRAIPVLLSIATITVLLSLVPSVNTEARASNQLPIEAVAWHPRVHLQSSEDSYQYLCELCNNGTRVVVLSPGEEGVNLDDHSADTGDIVLVRSLAPNTTLFHLLSTFDSTTWYNNKASIGQALSSTLTSNVIASFLNLYPNHNVIVVGAKCTVCPSQLFNKHISLWVNSADQLLEASLENRATVLLMIGQNVASATQVAFLQQVQQLLPLFISQVNVIVASLPISIDTHASNSENLIMDSLSVALKGLPATDSRCHCDGNSSQEWIAAQAMLKKALKKTAKDVYPVLLTTHQVRNWLNGFSADVIHTSYGQISQIGTWDGTSAAISWLPLYRQHAGHAAKALLLDQVEYAAEDWSREQGESHVRSRRATTQQSPCPAARITTLKGANLNVVTIVEEPFLLNSSIDNKYSLKGFSKDLLDALASQLGFNYTLRLVRDGQYGAKSPGGNWSGLVGEIVNCEADFVSAPLTISVGRSRVVDFSLPFLQLGLQVAIRKSYPGEPSFFQFLDPLSATVWGLVVVAGILASMSMALVNAWSPYSYRNARALRNEPPIFKCDCAIDEFTFYNSLWFMVGSFAQQGADKQPLSPSGRIVGMTWYLFGLVVINTYIANLAAFLTTNNRNLPINDITSLPLQDTLQYGTVLNSQPESFFKTTQITAYKRVWEGINTNRAQLVLTAKEGIDMVRSSNYAFIWDSPSLRYAGQRLPCDLEVRGNPFDLRGYGFAMPLGSAFQEEVSKAVLLMQENGLIHRLQEKWWDDRTQCSDLSGTSSGGGSEVITLRHVFGLMMVMAAGILVSLLILLAEVLYYSWKQSRKGADSIRDTVGRWSNTRFKPPTLTLPLSSKNNFVATMTRRSMFSRRGFGDSNFPATPPPAHPMSRLNEGNAKHIMPSGLLSPIQDAKSLNSSNVTQTRSESYIKTSQLQQLAMGALTNPAAQSKSTSKRKKVLRSKRGQRSTHHPMHSSSMKKDVPIPQNCMNVVRDTEISSNDSLPRLVKADVDMGVVEPSPPYSQGPELRERRSMKARDSHASDRCSLLVDMFDSDEASEQFSTEKQGPSIFDQLPRNLSSVSVPTRATSLRTKSLFVQTGADSIFPTVSKASL